jgi:very-short-patch-repair endonuclease
MSLPEVLLWGALRRRKLDGFRFRRQHPLGPYVLDFFCVSVGLAVEIDGEGHLFEEQRSHDERRDRFLQQRGIATFRIGAKVVLADPDLAAELVREAVTRRVETLGSPPRQSAAPPACSPQRGEI